MGDKAKKVLPILLAIWPYIIMVPCFLAPEEFAEGYPIWGYMFFGFLLLILNIINAFTYSGENASYELAFWNMLIKLIHIPFYVVIFLMGVLLLESVVPALIFFTPFMIMCLTIAAAILMIATSMYGVNALLREGRLGTVSIVYMVGMIVMHLCFVLDTIAAVILFLQMNTRKSKRVAAITTPRLSS